MPSIPRGAWEREKEVTFEQTMDLFRKLTGRPHRVKSIPDELEIVQQGKRPGHHELRPKVAMPVERFEELLKQVVLEPMQ